MQQLQYILLPPLELTMKQFNLHLKYPLISINSATLISINSTKSNESNQCYLNKIISFMGEWVPSKTDKLYNFSWCQAVSALTFEEFPVFVVLCNLASFNATYSGKLVWRLQVWTTWPLSKRQLKKEINAPV